MSKPKNWQKCSEVLQQRREGKTVAEIAKAMGISPGRVWQLANDAERREEALKNAESNPLELLSTHTRNCLLSEKRQHNTPGDRPTPDEVRDWLQSGRLNLIPNLGKKSIQEVAAWLDDVAPQAGDNLRVTTNQPEKHMPAGSNWYTATKEEAESIRFAAYKAAWHEFQSIRGKMLNGPAITLACIRAFSAAKSATENERAKLAARQVDASHIAPPIEITEIVCSALAMMDEEPNKETVTTSLEGLRIASLIQAAKAIEATDTLYSALDSNREVFGLYMSETTAKVAEASMKSSK